MYTALQVLIFLEDKTQPDTTYIINFKTYFKIPAYTFVFPLDRNTPIFQDNEPKISI